jgi:hypothetical protein
VWQNVPRICKKFGAVQEQIYRCVRMRYRDEEHHRVLAVGADARTDFETDRLAAGLAGAAATGAATRAVAASPSALSRSSRTTTPTATDRSGRGQPRPDFHRLGAADRLRDRQAGGGVGRSGSNRSSNQSGGGNSRQEPGGGILAALIAAGVVAIGVVAIVKDDNADSN